MSKKIISIILAVVLVFSLSAVAMVSASALPAKKAGCNRYYFYLPNKWVNELTSQAGIYWWEGTDKHDPEPGWPGVPAMKGDAEGVYYYDVPQDVTSVVWNNYLDGGMDKTQPQYTAAKQTLNIGTEYYDEGESDLYPDGLYEGFDEMIYVIDFTKGEGANELSGKDTVVGEWYYYYGNGEYGITPDKADAPVVYNYRAFGDIIINADGSEDVAPAPQPQAPAGDASADEATPDEDAQGSTDTKGENPDTVPTGTVATIYVAVAVLMMTVAAAVIIRKKVNG